MKIKTVAGVLSIICLVVSFAMFPSLAIAIYDSSYDEFPFALSIFTGFIISISLYRYANFKLSGKTSLGIRDGVCITGFSWIIASLIGALPYWFSGAASGYTDAFFETMSGFTTTGATIITDIEALPRGILLWRSLTHWIGGMGIIVLSLAILPFLGIGGMEMYKAEVPGISAEKIAPRLSQTAIRLWGVYLLLTLLEALFLFLGGMNLFDAFCHSCSTIATGGFSTKNNSIAYFSPYIQWVIIIFMFASGINFSLYFLLPLKRFREFLDDEEFRSYLYISVASAFAMSLALVLAGNYKGIEDTLRRTFFHVVSVMTTTGFIVEDYNLWPEFSRFLFVILMFIGASGGSTGGGCKVSRFLILGRLLKSEFQRLLHPRAVITLRLNGKPVAKTTMDSAGAFFVLYMLILASATLLTSAFGIDLLSAFTGVLTCLSNVGPGLNLLGPVQNFSWLPPFVKWLFSFCMLAGRLELFAVFILFLPGTYRK